MDYSSPVLNTIKDAIKKNPDALKKPCRREGCEVKVFIPSARWTTYGQEGYCSSQCRYIDKKEEPQE